MFGTKFVSRLNGHVGSLTNKGIMKAGVRLHTCFGNKNIVDGIIPYAVHFSLGVYLLENMEKTGIWFISKGGLVRPDSTIHAA